MYLDVLLEHVAPAAHCVPTLAVHLVDVAHHGVVQNGRATATRVVRVPVALERWLAVHVKLVATEPQPNLLQRSSAAVTGRQAKVHRNAALGRTRLHDKMLVPELLGPRRQFDGDLLLVLENSACLADQPHGVPRTGYEVGQQLGALLGGIPVVVLALGSHAVRDHDAHRSQRVRQQRPVGHDRRRVERPHLADEQRQAALDIGVEAVQDAEAGQVHVAMHVNAIRVARLKALQKNGAATGRHEQRYFGTGALDAVLDNVAG